MKLALVVPHKDRDYYKDFQKDYLPDYLSKQGIDHKIFFVEQKNSQPFNKGKTINYGMLFAIERYNPNYVIMSDIDMVPLNVDYRYNGTAETWFCNAGGIKMLTSDFVNINGYSNDYEGWGGEDGDFIDRIHNFKIKDVFWPHKNLDAKMVDLELPVVIDTFENSYNYFKIDNGPRFYHSEEVEETRGKILQKHNKDWYTPEKSKENFNYLDNFIRTKSFNELMDYYKNNGLNQLDIEKVRVERSNHNVVEIYWS